MAYTSTTFNKAALLLLSAFFTWNAYRAVVDPIRATEADSYNRSVRPPAGDMLLHYDPQNGLLYTLLAKRTIGLFRVSEFSLRLPGLIAAALFVWSIYRLSSRSPLWLLASFGLLGNGFYIAWGYGLALALIAISVEQFTIGNLNLAGIFLGISAAASLWSLPAVLACWLLMWFLPRVSASVLLDRVIVPSIVTGFLVLVIPISHAQESAAPAKVDAATSSGVRTLVQEVSWLVGRSPVRIIGTPDLEPVVQFYSARFRLRAGSGARDTYYVLASDANLLQEQHLRTLKDAGGLVLAQPGHDGTQP
jgi:hypothetical protein